MPDGIWATPHTPCPYDEVGYLKYSSWLPWKTTQDPEFFKIRKRIRPVLLIESDDFWGQKANFDIWNLVGEATARLISQTITNTGGDALIYPKVELAIVKVTKDECLSLTNYGCDINSMDYKGFMPTIELSGVVVSWRCPQGQPIPEQ